MKHIFVAIVAAAIVAAVGFGISVNAQSTNKELEFKARAEKAEKNALELGTKLKKTEDAIMAVRKIESLDDDSVLPDIDKSRKGQGEAMVIGPKGRVRAFGAKVIAVAMPGCVAGSVCPDSVLTVKVWGISLTVQVMADTKKMPEGTTFAAGDEIAFYGKMAGDAMVAATKVRNLSKVETKTSEWEAKIKELLEKIRGFCLGIPEAQRPAACRTM